MTGDASKDLSDPYGESRYLNDKGEGPDEGVVISVFYHLSLSGGA